MPRAPLHPPLISPPHIDPTTPLPFHRPAPQALSLCAWIAPTQDVAFLLAIAYSCITIQLGNFMVRWQEMTWIIPQVMRFISPIYYAFGALVRNEFQDRDDNCPKGPTSSSPRACTMYNNQVGRQGHVQCGAQGQARKEKGASRSQGQLVWCPACVSPAWPSMCNDAASQPVRCCAFLW